MKIFKMLFSKFALSALILLAQVFLIVAVAVWLTEYFIIFQIISTVIGLAMFLTIINKKEPCEFKLPWLVLFLIFPFLSLMIYLMFAKVRLSKKQIKRMTLVFNACKEQVTLNEETDNELKEKLGAYYGIERYLQVNAGTHGYFNNQISYYKVGEEFYADLLVELNKAEKFIFMEYFILDPGKMWDGIHKVLAEKAKAGVEVRLMYDDIGSMTMLKSNYYKKLQKEGINCIKFNPFRPIVSGIFNNRDHRKITVVDGKVAFTGGVNLGDEYINENHRLGHWKDTAIRVRGSAATSFTAMFLLNFDSMSKSSIDYEKYFPTEYESYSDKGYINFFGDGPKPAYNEYVGENNYINLINKAEKYVYITTPYLIIDYNMANALRSAAFRGVDVRIVTPHIPDKKMILTMTRSNYPFLMEAGVRIYEYTPGFIHAKGLIADDKTAFVGTINLDYRSLVHHFECGAVLIDTPCIENIKEDIDATISASQEIVLENFKLSWIKRLLASIINLFSPML